jgi:hypothetical protein
MASFRAETLSDSPAYPYPKAQAPPVKEELANESNFSLTINVFRKSYDKRR